MSRLFVDALTIIDCSYLHPARGLLGESWIVDLELAGGLDEQGMVLDFGEIKRRIKHAIDTLFDHRLIVPRAHPGLELSEQDGSIEVRFRLDSGAMIRHSSPPSALALLEAETVNSDTLCVALEHDLARLVPSNVTDIRVRLRTEDTAGPFYQYSHALKQHAGNCQRIAHGHRSRIEIYRDERRDTLLEEEWAERWRDTYIGSRDDLLDRPVHDGRHYCRFAYRASQGDFELELPESACYLIDVDSTVENLAQHIAVQLKGEHPASEFSVRAFEGVDKGAIGEG